MTSRALTHLDWDSQFFGVSIARADVTAETVDRVLEEAAAQHVECLYLFLPVAQSLGLTDALRRGGRLVDVRVELDLSTPITEPDGIRLAHSGDIPSLLPLTHRLAGESRFSADPRFAHAAVTRMYEIWLDRCLAEGKVVVPDRGFGGFVGSRTIGDTASIELVYVDGEFRGRGLAAKLVEGAVANAAAPRARVSTQASNIAAQRVYQSVGFRTSSIRAIVHLWLDDG
jgi:ribosomal protein S18 acetylase RimI-like enzyme